MSSQLIFFDLPSRDGNHCWSLNPWKTRLLLNYKNLPYETQWMEYPDIRPSLEGKVTPNVNEIAEYTIPAVKFPDGTYLQDSRKIAARIEKEHPDPDLHLNSENLRKLEGIMSELTPTVAPDFIPKVPKRILNEASLAFWYKDREARFGKPLDQVEQDMGGDTAWMNAAPLVREVTQMLKAKDGGPYFEGNQVQYIDFVWVAFLRFLQRIGDDIFNHCMEVSGDRTVHEAHLKACEPWLARDNY